LSEWLMEKETVSGEEMGAYLRGERPGAGGVSAPGPVRRAPAGGAGGAEGSEPRGEAGPDDKPRTAAA
jgi:hypothetical protein